MNPLITTGINAGMGIIAGEIQQRNQEQLMERQRANQKELMLMGQGMQKDMWDYTNYENQKKHMEAAGLNPALLYGSKGGGGVTTGSASGSAAGGSAMGIELGQQNAAQLALIESQVEVNKSQANKNNAEAGYTGGIQTELGKAQLPVLQATVDNLIASAKNTNAQTELTELKTAYQEIDNEVATATKDARIGTLKEGLNEITERVHFLRKNNYINDETADTQIKQAGATLLNTSMDTMLKNEHINLSKQQRQQMIDMTNLAYDQYFWKKETDKIEQGYRARETTVKEGMLNFEKMLNDQNLDRELKNDIMDLLKTVVGLRPERTVIYETKGAGGTTRTTVNKTR